MKKLKVYMAGPDVFRPDQLDVFAWNKQLLTDAGFIPLSPMDGDPPALDMSRGIYLGNMEMIESCDLVIANCNDFRGDCIDDGTAFEIGAAKALGKVIFGYRDRLNSMKDRLGGVDADGWAVEDFNLPVNLMIYHAIELSGGHLNHGEFNRAVVAAVSWRDREY